MKNGARVKHKLTGQTMVITNFNYTVATCKLDIPVFIPANRFFKEHYNEMVVCQTINLELIFKNKIHELERFKRFL